MKVLVVDDEAAMREVLKVRLEELGFDVRLAGDAAEASSKAKVFQPDLVISDVVMPDRSGLDLLRDLRAGDSERCVILMTAHGTVDMAVEAMKEGAKDFFTKPLDYSRFKTLLDDIQRELKARREPEKAAADPQRDLGQRGVFVGDSDRMRSVFQMIEEVAATEVPALLTGESGTGKELAARRIHHLSRRRHRPFIAINAAAIPSGLMESELFGHEAGAFTGAIGIRQGCFELANGGTLFLDEIAEMPPALQPKLLRVLEDGRVRRVGGSKEYQLDVRVLAATNQEPMTAIKKGRLRKDLYYRLNVFTIHLPPLRERPEDLPSLTGHFVDEFNLKYQTHIRGLAKGAVTLLEKYRWPGNVRELRNVLERAAVLARRGCIEPSHLPRQLQEPGSNPSDAIALPAGTTVADVERELILRTLDQTGKNKAEAARRLGIDVKTIRNKLKSYGTGRR